MKTKILIMLTAVLVIMGFAFPACKAAPEQQQPTAAAKPADPITWHLYTYRETPGSGPMVSGEYFVNEIAKQSGGRMKVVLHPGGSLAFPTSDNPIAVGKGEIQVGETPGASMTAAGGSPIFEVFDLPFLFTHSSGEKSKTPPELALKALMPRLEKAAANMNLVFAFAINGPMNQLASKKLVTKAEEFKGVKIRSYAPIFSDIVKSIGGTAITIPYAEVYSALQQGVVVMNPSASSGVYTSKQFEVAEYLLKWNIFAMSKYLFMNKNSFDALPADLQKIVKKVGEEAGKLYMDVEYWQVPQDEANLAKAGMKIVEIAPEEIAKLKALTAPIYDAWKKRTGPNEGQEILDLIDKAVQGK